MSKTVILPELADQKVSVGFAGPDSPIDEEELKQSLATVIEGIQRRHRDSELTIIFFLDDPARSALCELARRVGWRTIGVARIGDYNYNTVGVDELLLCQRNRQAESLAFLTRADRLVCSGSDPRTENLKKAFRKRAKQTGEPNSPVIELDHVLVS